MRARDRRGLGTDGEFRADVFWITFWVFVAIAILLGPFAGDVVGAALQIVFGGAFGFLYAEAGSSVGALFMIGMLIGAGLFLYWRYF